MNLTVTESISVVTVFLQGILSFFSPCVLPLLPLYIGYLSGGMKEGAYDNGTVFGRKRVILNTLCFVAGVGFSFFILGFGMRTVGRFFGGNQLLFAKVGGIIVILFGIYQLGVFGSPSFLMSEKRLPVRFEKMAMSPVTALIMGFVFSFAWTPCVGPTLSGVLLMAASEPDGIQGFILIGVYTLGFAIPFLLTGIFATTVLNFFRGHRSIVSHTVKLSGILLILMGILMITGRMSGITGYLSQISGTGGNTAEVAASEPENTIEAADEEAEDIEEELPEEDENEEETELLPAPDFTLTDQYGVKHTLSDYRGKVVFLNFWATWCPPCRREMPNIQALYEETKDSDDSGVVILGVAFPENGKEKDVEGIREFLMENGYTYPVLMDTEGELILPYYVTAYPMTYLIDRDGRLFGYVPGMMTKDMMEDAIRQTKEAMD